MREEARQKLKDQFTVAGCIFGVFAILQVASRITALMSSILLLAPFHMAFLYSGSEVLMGATVPRVTITLLVFLVALCICNLVFWFVPWIQGKKRVGVAHLLYFLLIHIPVGIWMMFAMVPETAH